MKDETTVPAPQPAAPPQEAPQAEAWRGGSPIARLGRRLENTKMSVVTVVAFMAFLGAMSGAAACIGYITHAIFKR